MMNRVKIRFVSIFLAVIGTAFLLTACGSEEGGEGQGGGQVQLDFRQFDPPQQIQGLQEAVDNWNSNNPDIQVNLSTMPQAESRDQFVREVQQGTGPDIIQLGFVDVRPIAQNDLLMDMGELLQGSSMSVDDFRAVELSQFEGRTYALPWTVDTFSLVYRPDLLEQAGVDMEQFPGNWSEFQSTVQEIASGSGGPQSGFCFPAGSGSTGGGWFMYNYYLWSNGNFLVQEGSDGNWEVGVTAEDVAGTMRYFNSFFNNGATAESLISINNWGDPALVGGLGRGDCAIGFMPPITFRSAQSQSETELGSAVIPVGSEQRVSHLGGRSLGVNPNIENTEPVRKFLEYLNSEETFSTYNQYPARKSAFEQLDFPEAEQGYVEMLPKAITFNKYVSSPASVPSMWESTNRQFGAVYSGQKSPEQASTDLIADLEGLLEEQ